MALLLDRHFWLLVPLSIVLCCVFGARATASLVEAQYLEEGTAPSARAVAPVATTDTSPPSKDGAALIERNMFCSSCVAQAPAEQAVAQPGAEVPATSLPLVLVATNVSTDPSSSFASVVNTSSSRKGSFYVGQSIPGAGPVHAITGRHVDFLNRASNRIERIKIDAAPAVAAKPEEPAGASMRRGGVREPEPGSFEARLATGVRPLGNNTFEVDKALVAEVTGNPTQVKVRAIPAMENGKVIGMKLSSIRPGSALDRLGLKNGDVLRAINGFEFSSPDKMLEAYTKLRTSTNLRLQVDRRGEKLDLSYRVM